LTPCPPPKLIGRRIEHPAAALNVLAELEALLSSPISFSGLPDNPPDITGIMKSVLHVRDKKVN
jgi:hypothetical protein